MEKNCCKKRLHPNLAFGILLVIIGAVVLALNLTGLHPILLWWQIIVAAFGVVSVINRKYLFGIYLVFVAKFFSIPQLAIAFPETFSWVEPDFLKTYWALLVVVAGVFLVIHRLCCRNRCHSGIFEHHPSWGHSSTESRDGFIRRELVFSGIEEIFNEPIFRGADLKCVFGGAEIDLRQAALPEGDTYVRVKCVFGGLVLIVPESWNVEIRVNNVFGGAADSRVKHCETDKTRRLIISGECVFGGCEIK